MSVVFVALNLVFAAAWQLDSSPFVFPAVGVASQTATVHEEIAIHCVYEASLGVATIHFNIPSKTSDATISVYNSTGSVVAGFKLNSNQKSIQWNVSKNAVANGVYLVTLKYGAIKKMTQLTIVK